MTKQNADLHGKAPDTSDLAVLLIDLISDFEFIDGVELFRQTLPVAEQIALNLQLPLSRHLRIAEIIISG